MEREPRISKEVNRMVIKSLKLLDGLLRKELGVNLFLRFEELSPLHPKRLPSDPKELPLWLREMLPVIESEIEQLQPILQSLGVKDSEDFLAIFLSEISTIVEAIETVFKNKNVEIILLFSPALFLMCLWETLEKINLEEKPPIGVVISSDDLDSSRLFFIHIETGMDSSKPHFFDVSFSSYRDNLKFAIKLLTLLELKKREIENFQRLSAGSQNLSSLGEDLQTERVKALTRKFVLILDREVSLLPPLLRGSFSPFFPSPEDYLLLELFTQLPIVA